MNNPLSGAPRIHGKLLKLGFEVAQSSDRQIHDQATRATGPGMAHLPAQSTSSSSRRSVSASSMHSDRAQRPRLDQRHKESDDGMGCPSDHRGISSGPGSCPSCFSSESAPCGLAPGRICCAFVSGHQLLVHRPCDAGQHARPIHKRPLRADPLWWRSPKNCTGTPPPPLCWPCATDRPTAVLVF
jgi:hypothetical protein